jgi:dipeptidase E
MKLLLTSSGITNASIENALVDMLGKPIEQSSALIVPTAIYPFPGGGRMAWRAITGASGGPLAGLPWKSMGVLELTALPSIEEEAWIPMLDETDALLVWGGDVLFLCHWLRQSGLAQLLQSARLDLVYVGVSAGSMAATGRFGETYVDPPRGTGEPLSSQNVVFETPGGQIDRILVAAEGLGLVDFALIPHLDNVQHEDASLRNAEIWAGKLPVPTYAIDDQTAIKVVDDKIELVSEGHWRLFNNEAAH